MQAYIIKRLLLFIPTLLGVIFINFSIIQFVPGGPVEQVLAKIRHGGQGAEAASQPMTSRGRQGLLPEQVEALNKLYEFDKPVYERFFLWTWRLVTFQFGESYFHNKKVVDLVMEKLPVSASFGVISFFLTYMVCIPLGIAKAVRDGSAFDVVTSAVVLIGYSIPGFVLGVLLIWLFAGGNVYDWFPLSGITSVNYDTLGPWDKLADRVHHLVLPMICLTIGSFAVMTVLTKNTVIDNLKLQYVTTARAKGLGSRAVLWKHVFRNSMIPLVTGFAGSFLTMFFSGSLLIEKLFSLDGLGLLSFNSVIQRDYPVVMASQYFFSLMFVVSNLLSDLMYVLVDPRIDFEGRTA
jgi:microcin C transport system permease protein